MRRIQNENLIDYSHYDEIFDNVPETIGSPFSDFEIQRREYARLNAINYKESFEVPEVPELVPRRLWKAPSTAKFWRSVVCHENNGRVTFFSKKMNMKAAYWMCYPLLIWGMTQHVTHGIWNKEHHLFSDTNNIYDKLHPRKIPYLTVWARPG